MMSSPVEALILSMHLRYAYEAGRDSQTLREYVQETLGSGAMNGCTHGFKPAKACPNEGCADALVQRAAEILEQELP